MVINGNLSVERDLYAEMENITIQCNPGYSLVGSANIICSENRTWYPEIPNCMMVSGTTQGTSVISPFITVVFSQGPPPVCDGVTRLLQGCPELPRFTLITVKHHSELEGVGFSALWLDPEFEN